MGQVHELKWILTLIVLTRQLMSSGPAARWFFNFSCQLLDCFDGHSFDIDHFATEPATDTNGENADYRHSQRKIAVLRQRESELQIDRKNHNSAQIESQVQIRDSLHRGFVD